MNKKTIKCVSLICSMLLFLSLFTLTISSKRDESAAFSWYIRRAKNNEQPVCEPDMSFVSDFNAYYMDKGAPERGDKVIYLTFDAGYENGNIERILNVLKEENVPAAFFILKNLIEREPALVKRMADDGHIVANHTMRHRDMTKFTEAEAFKAELDGLCELYREATGCEMSKYYRPPEGRFSELNLKYAADFGYKTVFWSLAYADWDNDKQPTHEYAFEKLNSNIHNGAVVLLHPTSSTNAEILSDLIRGWKSQGYRFGTLDELTSYNTSAAETENEENTAK